MRTRSRNRDGRLARRVYKLVEKGLLDEGALNNYLNAADSIGGKKP
jgi:hypothetical protein